MAGWTPCEIVGSPFKGKLDRRRHAGLDPPAYLQTTNKTRGKVGWTPGKDRRPGLRGSSEERGGFRLRPTHSTSPNQPAADCRGGGNEKRRNCRMVGWTPGKDRRPGLRGSSEERGGFRLRPTHPTSPNQPAADCRGGGNENRRNFHHPRLEPFLKNSIHTEVSTSIDITVL